MTDQETAPTYMIFIMVSCFFFTGLLGFFCCHLLKGWGYRCRTAEPEDEECKNSFGTENYGEDNEDTVERILKCIIENEANMEAFSEMLGNQPPSAHHNLRFLRKESVWSIPTHHHTIHMGTDLNFCHHCGHGHGKKSQCRTHMYRTKGRPGEQTVLSVGRFRVTHMEKKSPTGSTNVTITESRDQSDYLAPLNSKTALRDGTIPKNESYDIRNMFTISEAANTNKPYSPKPKKRDSLPVVHRGSDAVSDAVGLASNAVSDAVDLHSDGVSDAVGLSSNAVENSVGLGSNAVSDSVGLGSDAVSLGSNTVSDAVGLGSNAVSDAVGLGSDAVCRGTDAVSDAVGQ